MGTENVCASLSSTCLWGLTPPSPTGGGWSDSPIGWCVGWWRDDCCCCDISDCWNSMLEEWARSLRNVGWNRGCSSLEAPGWTCMMNNSTTNIKIFLWMYVLYYGIPNATKNILALSGSIWQLAINCCTFILGMDTRASRLFSMFWERYI